MSKQYLFNIFLSVYTLCVFLHPLVSDAMTQKSFPLPKKEQLFAKEKLTKLEITTRCLGNQPNQVYQFNVLTESGRWFKQHGSFPHIRVKDGNAILVTHVNGNVSGPIQSELLLGSVVQPYEIEWACRNVFHTPNSAYQAANESYTFEVNAQFHLSADFFRTESWSGGKFCEKGSFRHNTAENIIIYDEKVTDHVLSAELSGNKGGEFCKTDDFAMRWYFFKVRARLFLGLPVAIGFEDDDQ